MTPAARFAAAIEVLDDVFAGAPAERTLTTWARKNRFAGSKDRAAIRDHVYDVLRARRSLCAAGGETTARAAILGLLRRDGIPVDSVFGAGGYGPAALSPDEVEPVHLPQSDAISADLPDWLWPLWQASLGQAAMATAQLMRHRASVYLRVNLSRGTRDEAIAALARDGIVSKPVDQVKTAIEVIENERKVAGSSAFASGLVEVQDTASQIAMAQLLPVVGRRVLDYCAGGGGKALALADQTDAAVYAHDIDPARMADIAPRALRAGVQVTTLRQTDLIRHAPYDLVLCDAPCSGSGTWRRTPDAKWRLTPQDLDRFSVMQAEVLENAKPFVAQGGTLAYATCSVLNSENDAVVDAFLRKNSDFRRQESLRLLPRAEHDGIFLTTLLKIQP
ncbi:hypothetical protein AN189_03745 [Loktanella sp. 3ANDIMAR09]|uniref:RsmB/NOP family class I SAM-dependent RNA methyltransferase n=1 Tax=Loktanella sp. 3ANDIMAR09 TaxID=1225657 RepID=UPI000700486E|nr:RsmB/NOP family class I SAM-dependent RNA methyltransferase [Loktanella sp. 3ANDIMAR09]KQI69524.1 hypothetical protein AN189_03745 [Loktanella sp. 3ANDIMAR09]